MSASQQFAHQFDAVAIRLDPLGPHAPQGLIGLSPVVTFVEQGLQGASLPNGPTADIHPPRHHSSLFNLHRVIFIVDRSTSMDHPLKAGDPQTKYDYIQQGLSNLAPDLFSPLTNISLIEFNSRTVATDCGNVQNGALRRLQHQLRNPFHGSGTTFEEPLRFAQHFLTVDRNLAQHLHQPSARSLIVFLTDGIHTGNEKITPIIDSIRKLNATTLVCGIGENYAMEEILTIAQHAGAAGWSHIPLDRDGADPFTQLLPEFVGNLRSQEHYLRIDAAGSYARLTAITPTIREAVPGRQTLHIGYQPQAAGLLFPHSEDIELSFRPGNFNGDRTYQKMRIAIHDADSAGAHFERLQLAENVVKRFMVLQALRTQDPRELGKLVKMYPDLAELLGPAIDQLSQGDSASRSSQSIRALMSEVSGMSIHPNSSQKEQSGLHSGGLGDLFDSRPVTSLPDMGQPNPAAYNMIEPRQRRAPSLSIPDYFHVLVGDPPKKAQVIPLNKLQEGGGLVMGRAPQVTSDQSNCMPVQIVHDEVHLPYLNRILAAHLRRVSRDHFSIMLLDGAYLITDLGSTNGTYLRRKQTQGENINIEIKADRAIQLCDGDAIRVGDLEFVFTVPKGA